MFACKQQRDESTQWHFEMEISWYESREKEGEIEHLADIPFYGLKEYTEYTSLLIFSAFLSVQSCIHEDTTGIQVMGTMLE